jgi:hypothetical protein
VTGIASPGARADGKLRGFVLAPAAMEIGDLVTYNGKSYVLRGLEPMSVPERRAEIEDPESGERHTVPLALLTPGPQQRRGLSPGP